MPQFPMSSRDSIIEKDSSSPSSQIRIPFHRIAYDHEEEQAITRALSSGWITTGEECRMLEDEFAQTVNAAQAGAVSSATAGLHLAILLGSLAPKSCIAVSPLTFASCAQVIIQSGHRPFFIDIAPNSFHMDPQALEASILDARNTNHPITAIMCVHYAGEPRFIEDYVALAKKYDLWLIEDAAHCSPIVGEHHGYPAKDVAVFSFYATKPLSSAEGGMICMQDATVARTMQVLRSHGISTQSWQRYKNQSATYEVISDGFKYNLSDIQAALARVQLKKQIVLQNRRKEIAQLYHKLLKDNASIILPNQIHPLHSWHLFVIQVCGDAVNREAMVQKLQKAGIQTSIHFTPLHHQRYFKSFAKTPLPHVDSIAKNILSLPIYPALSSEDIEYISAQINAVCA